MLTQEFKLIFLQKVTSVEININILQYTKMHFYLTEKYITKVAFVFIVSKHVIKDNQIF